jgi:hypothetical protein
MVKEIRLVLPEGNRNHSVHPPAAQSGNTPAAVQEPFWSLLPKLGVQAAIVPSFSAQISNEALAGAPVSERVQGP